MDAKTVEFSTLEKQLINELQKGLPVCEKPFEQVAEKLGTTEENVIEHLQKMLDNKVLSRFGPMFDAACLGGAFTLAALAVPEERFEQVNDIVNSFEQVAHNYKREHYYNMWFVIGTETEQEILDVIEKIEAQTGLEVLNAPKMEEFYVGLYLPV